MLSKLSPRTGGIPSARIWILWYFILFQDKTIKICIWNVNKVWYVGHELTKLYKTLKNFIYMEDVKHAFFMSYCLGLCGLWLD